MRRGPVSNETQRPVGDGMPAPDAFLAAPFGGHGEPIEAPETPYLSPKRMATLLTVMIGVGLLLDAVAVWSDLRELSLLQRIVAGVAVSEAEGLANDTRQRSIALLQMALLFITAPFFIAWFRRAYLNLARLGSDLHFGPGWAIGGWFVPLLNLIRPKQIADEIWRGSDPDAMPSLDAAKPRVAAIVHIWWALWIINNVLGYALWQLPTDTLDDFVLGSRATLAFDITSVLLGVAAILFIRRVSAREDLRMHRVVDRLLAEPAPNPAI